MRRAAIATAVRAATALALLALAVTALALGPLAEGDEAGARLAATSTDGSFAHSNSRDGQPLFTVAALAPGASAAGDVTLRNTGTLAARFTLSAAGVSDLPGPNGGVLSRRLRLTVADVTDPAQPQTVYDGALATMPPRDVGVFAPGQARSFRFVALLPDAGDAAGPADGDNAFQGSGASVGYVWDAVQHGEQPSPPADAPPVPQPPVVAPAPDAAPAPEGTVRRDTRRPRVRLGVPRVQRVFSRGHLRMRLRSHERARVEARGWLRAGHVRLRLPRSRARIRPGRTLVLRVRVPVRHRRAMRRALVRGRGAKLRVVVTVTDRAGNRSFVRRTLRVRAG